MFKVFPWPVICMFVLCLVLGYFIGGTVNVISLKLDWLKTEKFTRCTK